MLATMATILKIYYSPEPKDQLTQNLVVNIGVTWK